MVKIKRVISIIQRKTNRYNFDVGSSYDADYNISDNGSN